MLLAAPATTRGAGPYVPWMGYFLAAYGTNNYIPEVTLRANLIRLFADDLLSAPIAQSKLASSAYIVVDISLYSVRHVEPGWGS
jgi:hypothetical protein